MSWLTARLRDDRGGITLLAVVMIAGGVMLGAGALVTDVGGLYAERAELQTGADSAATAIAEECGRSPAACAATAASVGAKYADGNASDGAASAAVICGRGTGTALATCPPPATNRTRCVVDAPATGNYVEVRTRTRLANGSTLLPPTLARGLVGNGSFSGTSVSACARAAWGAPATSSGLALTTSYCEWNEATANGTSFAPNPSVGLPAAALERIVYIKGDEVTACPGAAGWNAPGGFGWLDEVSPCTATVTANGSIGGSSGVAVSQSCRTVLAATRASHAITYMPIYDGVSGNGSHVTYHTLGVAAFVITGYSLSGFSASSWLTGRDDCGGHGAKCLFGYFTAAVAPATGPLTSQSFGVSIVALSG